MKLLKALVLVLLLGSQLSSMGQWKEATWPLSTYSDANYIKTQVLSYDTIYTYLDIGGGRSRISYDNGSTWNSLPTDDIRYYVDHAKVYSIKGDSLMYSIDSGTTWSFKSTGHSKYAQFFILNDSSLVTHFGVDSVIYKSSNYGLSWDTIVTPRYVHPTSLVLNFEAQSADVFKMMMVEKVPSIDYFSNPYLVSTYDGGTTWDTIVIEHGPSYNGQYLIDDNRIYSPNDSQVYYTGESELSRLNLRSNSWDTTNFFDWYSSYYDSDKPRLLAFYNNTIIAACDSTERIDSTIAISNDNGRTWQWQDLPSNAPWYIQHLEELVLYDEYYGVASSSFGSILVYDARFSKRNFLGPDIIVCDEYAIDLSQYSNIDSIRWNDGDTTLMKTVSESGLTWATVYRGMETFRDTIDIGINTASITRVDTSFCLGGEVSADRSFTSYLWSTGDTSDWVSLTQSGSYWLEVTDANGCSASDTFSVEIYSLPTITLRDTLLCPGESVEIDAGSFNSYRWSTGATSSSITVNMAGDYSVEVTDTNGCRAIDTFEMTTFPNPILEMPDAANCGGSIVIPLSIFSTYSWSTGDTSDWVSLTQSGSYWLEVTDANGCSASDTFSVEIYSLPTITLRDTLLCPGESVEIDAGSFNSYRWSTGATSSSITVNMAGDYSVEVTDTNGCRAIDTAIVGVYLDVVFTLGADTALCADSITLNVALQPLATSYAWSTGDTSDWVLLTQSGSYWLEVTDANGCYSRDTISLTLHAAPNAPVISRAKDTLYTTSSLTHQWFKDGLAISGQSDSILPSITAGSYQVIVVDSNGCESDTSNLLLYTAGVTRLLADGAIRAFPNPSNGGVSLECIRIQKSEVISVRLVNVFGQELPIQTTWIGNKAKLTWDIAPQVVWLVVDTDHGTYRTQIIER